MSGGLRTDRILLCVPAARNRPTPPPPFLLPIYLGTGIDLTKDFCVIIMPRRHFHPLVSREGKQDSRPRDSRVHLQHGLWLKVKPCNLGFRIIAGGGSQRGAVGIWGKK